MEDMDEKAGIRYVYIARPYSGLDGAVAFHMHADAVAYAKVAFCSGKEGSDPERYIGKVPIMSFTRDF